jgi:hypothetical protein
LAARFNQFFLEPLGADKFVPGFGKSSEDIFGGNIFAFALEYALPGAITGLTKSQSAGLTGQSMWLNFHLSYPIICAPLVTKKYCFQDFLAMFPEGGQTWVVYHLHGNSGDSIRKVNGTSIFRLPNRNFSGMNGLFEKVVLSYRLERFNR